MMNPVPVPVVVEAIGGLANRVRVTLSYRAAYGRVDVVWRRTGEIGRSAWSDVFESLDGVRFFDDYLAPVHKTTDPLHNSWLPAYRDVRLRADHRARFEQLRAGVSICDRLERPSYQAMHVRRTDLGSDVAPNAQPDRDFVAWALRQPGPVYIATDNGTTQREMAAAIREKDPFFLATIPEHDRQNETDQRNTPLADAAIDLFFCAGADAFMGTNGSSFTSTVEALRQIHGWWSNHDAKGRFST
jgi:hypothetical protein